MSSTEREKVAPSPDAGTEAAEPSAESAAEEESLEIEVEAAEEEGQEPGEGKEEAEADPLAALQAQVETLEAEKKENYDRFVRASADLENFRKRSRRDIKDARLDERGKILKDMLPVIDNLERAVAHAKQSENEATKGIIEGVTLVMRQFQQALERHQVKAIDAVGKPFDPALHEAVSQAPSAEHAPGTVLSVLQTGYMMEERLLRPALAVVSVAAPASEEAASEESTESSAEASSEEEGGA